MGRAGSPRILGPVLGNLDKPSKAFSYMVLDSFYSGQIGWGVEIGQEKNRQVETK